MLAVVAVLAGAAAAFVLDDALASESFRPSAGQIALTAPTIAGLVVAAESPSPRRVHFISQINAS